MTETVKPLAGLKVVELARILAGPWIGQCLADLGATVIKVESPDGDDTRSWGPPFIEHESGRSAAYFHAANRGKRSITLDFNQDEDKAILLALLDEADILIENFKVGSLSKHGLDHDSLSIRNPRLITCSVTGFGQTGPWAHRAGYDVMIQAMSGIMDLTGAADGPPQKMGVAFADIFTGLYGVIGIQAALAERTRTGAGRHIDMALYDSMIGVLGNQAMNVLASGMAVTRMGNAHPNIVPYQDFPALDGHLIIACGNDRQFERLCGVLELGEAVLQDHRSNAQRVAQRDTLIPLLSDHTRRLPRDTLLTHLEVAGIPAGPINTVKEAVTSEQARARNLVIEPDGIPGLRMPLRFTDADLHPGTRAPGLNEHGDCIRNAVACGSSGFGTLEGN